jgi:ATP-dependent RNA helicase DHX33
VLLFAQSQALGIDDVLSFEFVSPPPLESLVAALEQLLALGALDATSALSSQGRLMSKLPLEPSYSKALLQASGDDTCMSPMLTLVAMLSVEGAAFVAPAAARERADEARRRFACAQADTLTLVNVFAAFGGRTGSAAKTWCEDNFVNRRTLESAGRVRAQLRDACVRLSLLSEKRAAAEQAEAAEAMRMASLGLSHVDEGMSRALRRCLTCAFFANAAERQPSGEYLALTSRQSVAIHPSSGLFSRRASCVLFNELLYTTKLYMRELTQIDPEWLPELAPQCYASGRAQAGVPVRAPARGGAAAATFGARLQQGRVGGAGP